MHTVWKHSIVHGFSIYSRTTKTKTLLRRSVKPIIIHSYARVGVAKLWEENNFLVPWKHGSVIRSDQLVNFSGFTVIFVLVFHSMALFNYYSSKKSKSGVNEKMPMACLPFLAIEIFGKERMNNSNFVLTYLF